MASPLGSAISAHFTRSVTRPLRHRDRASPRRNCAEATAQTRVARILPKLGLLDRIQIVIYAYETALISPGLAACNDQPSG
jgi:hypothetical protein